MLLQVAFMLRSIGLRDQLGHNSIETTVLYTNFSQEGQRDLLRKMDKKNTTGKGENK
ncbi:hypothetical protein [Paenisporosarcina sp.]|uniref:hypothetical protein n=1 Tax=Paenisporosarcina sp. TaxID=1932001 RepID=UPI003C78570C